MGLRALLPAAYLFAGAFSLLAQEKAPDSPFKATVGSFDVAVDSHGSFAATTARSSSDEVVTSAIPKLSAKQLIKQATQKGPALWLRSREYNGDSASTLNQQRKDLALKKKPLGRFVLIEDSSCEGRCQTVFVNTAKTAMENRWVEGFRVTMKGLWINKDLFNNPDLTFVVNGWTLRVADASRLLGSQYTTAFHIQVFEDTGGCRRYVPGAQMLEKSDAIDIAIPPQAQDSRRQVDSNPQSANGITVGDLKVYDSFALRTLMNNAATQLAAISPWNATAITNAYGTLQGVTRDVSYVAAQLQTAATPTAQSTFNVPSQVPAITNTQSTGQCPAGYVPTLGASGAVSCAQVPLVTIPSNAQCPAGTYATAGSTAGTVACVPLGASPLTASYTSQAITSPSGPNSTVVTTIPSLAPTIPSAPASTALTAPSNLSVSAPDMLAEQVQLNAQLQMYQMLLTGSQSDQLVLKNSRAVANRAQTTIGLQISLAPPRQFRHAVAEVRVIMIPPPDRDRDAGDITVVNLLPSQKTYNVAKITSHQNSFGAGVAVEQVSAGVSTGRAKDRLYLAKDTDTVALEYPNPAVVSLLHPPIPERAWEGMEAAIKLQRLDECDVETLKGDDPGLHERLKAVRTMFGWQFRPVLGADYVAAGPRRVFAQLALPDALQDQNVSPAVYVQTRWRQYDENRQVVGPVYHSSCTIQRLPDSAIVINPLRIHDVTWEDMGGGTLKMRAEGEFFQTGMTVLTAGNNISPVTFDGNSVQFFAPAKDLLQNGSVQILGENREATYFGIEAKEDFREPQSCGIDSAKMRAVPYPDGNSWVRLDITYGNRYKEEVDRARPLVLIGSDVYGLKEKPFTRAADKPCGKNTGVGAACYEFTAPTDSLRSAQIFLVRDLAWEGFAKKGAIEFAPSVTSLAAYSAAESKDPWYFLSGFNFSPAPSGLKVYENGDPKGAPLTKDNFKFLSGTAALIKLSGTPGSSVKIASDATTDSVPVAWDLTIPKADQKQSPSSDPAALYVGDSRTVTFSGQDFSKVVDVVFEGTTLLPPPITQKNLNNQIAVPVSDVVTRTPGYKELLAETPPDSAGNKGTPMVLSIQVLRR